MSDDIECIELMENNVCYLKESISESLSGELFTVSISKNEHSSNLLICFGQDHWYSFGLLNKLVDWRILDARCGKRQQLIVDLVDNWAKNIFADMYRRRACEKFAQSIHGELLQRTIKFETPVSSCFTTGSAP